MTCLYKMITISILNIPLLPPLPLRALPSGVHLALSLSSQYGNCKPADNALWGPQCIPLVPSEPPFELGLYATKWSSPVVLIVCVLLAY